MNLRTLASIARRTGRGSVVLLTCILTCALTLALGVSTAHSKPTAKPAFNAAAKGMRPVYKQPKPVLRPPAPRPRGVAASPTARKMYTPRATSKAASRTTANTRTRAPGARNLRTNFANSSQRGRAATIAAASRHRVKGPVRNLRSNKRPARMAVPAKSNRTARASLRNNFKKAGLKHKAKSQFGRAVGVPHATGNIRTRLTKPGETFYRVHSGATRGPYATPVKPKTSNQAKSSLALPRSNKATHLQKIVAPGGKRITESRAAAAFGKKGGAPQVRFQDKLPASAFKSLGWLKGGLSNVFNDVSG